MQLSHRLCAALLLAGPLLGGWGGAARAEPAMATMPGMDMGAPPSQAKPAAGSGAQAPAPPASMPGMDMSQDMPGMAMEAADAHPSAAAAASGVAGMAGMAGMSMAMAGDLGAYPMTRDASGTSWQPDSAPMQGVYGHAGAWALMADGYATLSYDDQGGPRGGDKTFVESMLMGMAQRPLEGGTLTLRAMGSLDPLMGASGYPLLLATGETANGKTALVDRQHPHDLVMELAGAYQHPLAGELHGFLYAGWPGEPAIGPVTYMHRVSGGANPEAPIGHHWLDSTHVTFGVVTGGLVWRDWKLETSWFKGREPNQYRYDFDHPRLDSWSARLSWNPTPDWSLQVSHAHLKSPEQLEPDVDQDRTTASATYNRAYGRGRWWSGDWQTTAAWGEDRNAPGRTLDAYLLDTAASLGPHTVFFRAENDAKDELFDDQPASLLYGRAFDVSEYTTGYYYTVPVARALALDVGGLVTRYSLPAVLDGTYGADPTSFLLFTRVKLR